MPRLPAPRSSLASLLGISRQFRRELSGNRRFHMSAEQNAELLAIDDEEAPKRLVKSFDIETIDTNLYRSNALVRGLVGRDAVYGGQVIGQSLRAAQDTVESDRAPHSMHCYFLQAGSVVKPIVYLVDRVREGGSFSTRIVKAIQDGKVLFTTQISFQKHEDGGMRHSRTMPEVPPPSSLLSYRDLLKEALSDHERKPSMTDHQAMLLEFKLANTPPTFHRVYEHRPVDQKIFDFSRRKGIEPQRSWIKTVVPYGDLPALQRQLAAYISDSAVIDAALFPHLARGFIPSMVFSLDHAIWFHQPAFTLDKWCLLEVESDYAAYAVQARLGPMVERGSILMRESYCYPLPKRDLYGRSRDSADPPSNQRVLPPSEGDITNDEVFDYEYKPVHLDERIRRMKVLLVSSATNIPFLLLTRPLIIRIEKELSRAMSTTGAITLELIMTTIAC